MTLLWQAVREAGAAAVPDGAVGADGVNGNGSPQPPGAAARRGREMVLACGDGGG